MGCYLFSFFLPGWCCVVVVVGRNEGRSTVIVSIKVMNTFVSFCCFKFRC